MTSRPHGTTYRPDIDGLRALAVLSVVGFHAASKLFPGGYVGVDIFFVISGYLITSIIARELDSGSFTFARFYVRRCKRIFPALILVLVSVLAFGWLFLLSNEYQRLGKHIAAGAAFVSNFAYWLESGYFDKAAESKPLLHLWSLGIEEQFYFLWPPLLVWAWRRKWNALSIAVGIVAVSFAINVVLVTLWQVDVYYLPFVRFWELLSGGALAFGHLFHSDEIDRRLKRFGRAPSEIQAAAGLLMILIAIAALKSGILFPGYWALLPAIGTVLLINAGSEAWINRQVFSNRAVVYVGLISYPLYLWHWPLLSYTYILAAGAPTLQDRFIAIAVAFALAAATYHLIEKPVRVSKHRTEWILAAGLVMIAALGVATFKHQLRSRSEAYGFDKIVNAASGTWGFPGPELKLLHTSLGYYLERGQGNKVLFVGDSHMQQYYPRVDRVMTENPNAVRGALFVTHLACPPIPEVEGITRPTCRDLAENAIFMAARPGVDAVVIGAAWNRYNHLFETGAREKIVEALSSMIINFKKGGRPVYLILPIPRGELFDPSRLVNRNLRDLAMTLRTRVERDTAQASRESAAAALIQVAQSTDATVIDPMDLVCNAEYCPTLADDGLPVYTDDSHLRPTYVREHARFLDPIMLLDAQYADWKQNSLSAKYVERRYPPLGIGAR